jgi:hypothetical protein
VEIVLPLAVIDLQRRCNAASADRWVTFRDHRRRVTDIAIESGGQTLAVLGAGNCNDLELGALAVNFREVHLVDLDREALLRAQAAVPAFVARKLVLHTPVDLSGVLPRLETFRRARPTDRQIASLPSAILESVLAAVPVRFDTVVSSCLLSQLLHGCAVALGSGHPDLPLLSCVIALAHVRCVASLALPGGCGVVITDMASSERHFRSELSSCNDLGELARELEEMHRCASGTGPAFLRKLVVDDAVITPLLAGVPRTIEPWLWRFGDELTYLVHGVAFRRRHETI